MLFSVHNYVNYITCVLFKFCCMHFTYKYAHVQDLNEEYKQDSKSNMESINVEGSRKRKHHDKEIESTKKPKLEEASTDVCTDDSAAKQNEMRSLNVISKYVSRVNVCVRACVCVCVSMCACMRDGMHLLVCAHAHTCI